MTDQKPREAGRALDAEIAERVFGCTVTTEYPATIARIPVCGCGDGNWHGWRARNIPSFSTDIGAAFGWVVEAMRAKGFAFRCDDNLGALPWYVGFRNDDPSPIAGEDFEAEAPILPLAICLAALAALDASSAKSVVSASQGEGR